MTTGPRMRRRRRGGVSLLAPPRDTGIRLRETGRGRSGTRLDPLLAARLAGVFAVLLAVAGAAAVTSRTGGLPVDLKTPVGVAPADVARASAATFTRPVDPTPYFGSFRGVKLRLPVAPNAVTAFAYHQAAPAGPLPIVSLVAKKSRSEAERLAGRIRTQRAAHKRWTPPASATQTAEAGWAAYRLDNGVWTGRALELWRTGRTGRPDNAVDCGAAAGTPVYSPVDGTVMEIRPYRLYGKYFDYEIHIKPDAWSDVDVVLLHTTDPAVQAGRHVVAGVDRLSSVRRLTAMVPDLQLGDYTLQGGDHTHLQINRIPKPYRTWIVGQDPPGWIRNHP